MVKHLRGDIWMRDDGVYFKTTRPRAIGGVCDQCALWASDNCISGNSLSCEAQIGGRFFKKNHKERSGKNYG